MIVRLFRDPNADSGGGTQTDPTNPTVEGVNADGTLMEGYQFDALGKPEKITSTDLTDSTEEEEVTEVEGLNAEGNLLEGYEQLEDGTIQKIGGSSDPVPTPVEEAAAFYAAVESISGENYEVEYGDADPISPEGIALRDRVVKQRGAEEFEKHLKSSFPKGYAYFLHLQSGGDDETFFSKATPTLPGRTDFESDTEAQSRMVLNSLISKGVDPDIAQASVDKYIKDNTLTTKALGLYDAIATDQLKQVEELDKFNKQQQEAFNASVSNLLSSYDKAIKSEMSLIVPENKQQEFMKFLQDRTRWDNGKFYFTQEINQDLPKLVEQMYYAFVKGDLKTLVERKAKAITTQRLRIAVEKDKAAQQKAGNGTPASQKFVPLSEIKF